MDNEPTEETNSESSPPDIDWENRVLCSDGNCIGVIGPDGRCKECGKKDEGPDLKGSPVEDDMREKEAEVEEEEEIIEEKESQGDLVWENRTLCSDGNCIGVIGPDGRCKECGKPNQG